MKKHDALVTLKLSSPQKAKLEEEAGEKGVTLSELIRMRINNTLAYQGDDIPSVSLEGPDHLSFKRCPRCNGIFPPKHSTQLFCCNGCGCKKTCSCGAIDRQRLLII
jgi:hypothetical protein